MAVLSLNDRANLVADEMVARAGEIDVEVHTVGGARVIDAGAKQFGSLSAGIMLARACMADLGTAKLDAGVVKDIPLPFVTVNVNHPIAACLASQYAGWQISAGKYFAMGSGPMRAAYGKEELFNDIGLREKPRCAVGILETSKLPTEEVVQLISEKTQIHASRTTLLVARTASLAGGVQIVARSVETALHKLHALHFDLKRIVAGFGSAPLPPVAHDDLAALGRTNDSVLYGAQVVLYVTGDDDSLVTLGEQLPSSTSKDYGQPFAQTFKQANYDFYKIDPMLFSPACVVMNNLTTGRTHRFGQVNHDVLAASFFS